MRARPATHCVCTDVEGVQTVRIIRRHGSDAVGTSSVAPHVKDGVVEDQPKSLFRRLIDLKDIFVRKIGGLYVRN